MKRASYRDAIDWVAQMDSPADPDSLDPDIVGGLTTAILVAEIFDVLSSKVGADIVKRRKAIIAENVRRNNESGK